MTLRQVDKYYHDLDFTWACALIPYAFEDNELLGEARDLEVAADYIGVRTLGGETLPLTKKMLSEMKKIFFWKGSVSAVMDLPGELGVLDDHDPVPYLDLFMTPGPTIHMPDEVDFAARRTSIYCSVDAEDVEVGRPVLTFTARPEEWPR